MDKSKMNTLILILILLVSVFNIFIPDVGSDDVTVYPDAVFPVGNINYSVSPAQTYRYMEIGSNYIRFNNTNFSVYSVNPVNITIHSIIQNVSNASANSMIASFNAMTTSGTVFFNISNLKINHNYIYCVDNGSSNNVFSDYLGSINFSYSSWSSHYFLLLDGGDTTSPIIKILFAGNLGEDGGPLYQPPEYTGGKYQTLLSGTYLNGYYANDSYQTENYIYIVCNATDNVAVNTLRLHWKTNDTWDNTSYVFTRVADGNYTFNSSGLIAMDPVKVYSFDVLGNDTSNNQRLIMWNKTVINLLGDGTYLARRTVHLAQTNHVNLSYTPIYLNDICGYPGFYQQMHDIEQHDQGNDGGMFDTGYMTTDPLSDDVVNRSCANFFGYWINQNNSVYNITVNNVYAHFWWNNTADNHSAVICWNKSREDDPDIDFDVSDVHYPNMKWINRDNDTVSNVSYTHTSVGGSGSTYHAYGLTSMMMMTNQTESFTENSIYQFFFTVGLTSSPELISNVSFKSFILLNVPDNATLNATGTGDTDSDGLTDWTELYVTYTSPFLSDTDNDGKTDYEESQAPLFGYVGSDPNNYTNTTDFVYTGAFPPIVSTNESTGVTQTNATLNGYLNNDGGTIITPTLYENYNTGDDTGYAYVFDDWLFGQTFTSIGNHNLNKIRLKLVGYHDIGENMGNLTVELYATDVSGLPTGSNLSWGIIDGNIFPEYPGAWGNISMTSYPLINGMKYAIVMTPILHPDPFSIEWRGDSDAPSYPGGNEINKLWGGGWSNDVNIDLMFEVYSNDTTNPCFVHFEYGTTTGYGTNTSNQSKLTGDTFLQNIIGLSPSTLYHFRAVANNSAGTSYGVDKSFTTMSYIGITTNPATNINETQATLNGNLNNSSMVGNTVRFEYGTTTAFGTNTTNQSMNEGDSFSATITGLLPGHYYYFRAFTNDSLGYTALGETLHFLTKPFPPTNGNITFLTGNTIRLNWTKGTGANNTILIKSSTGVPTSITDGTLLYNGTALFYDDTFTSGTTYYYKAWSYTNWSDLYQFSDNGTTITYSGSSAMFINVFDSVNYTNLTFNIFIANQDGSEVYTNTSQYNTLFINASLLPQGQVTITINATGYRPAVYSLDIGSSLFFVLNAYLSPISLPPGGGGTEGENYTRQYRMHIIDQKSDSLPDVYIVVKKYMNSTGVYESVGSGFSDGYGDFDLWLLPSTAYKVFLTKTGYNDIVGSDWMTDPTFYGANYPKIFMMTSNLINVTIPPTFYDTIVFNGSMFTNGSIYVNYVDSLSETLNAQFYTYEVYNFTFTLVDTRSILAINSYQYWITSINASRQHMVTIMLNHTTLGFINSSIYLEPANNSLYHDPSIVENALTDVYGNFDLGYVRFFIEFLPFIGILVLLGRIEAGMGIFAGALWLAFIGKIFGDLPVELWQVLPIILIFAVLWYIATKGKFRL